MRALRSESNLGILVAMTVSLVVTAVVVGQGPPPVSTGDTHPVLPGDWPYRVTATNIDISPIPGSVLDGTGSNTLKVVFPSGGPIKWTESRHNEGDISLLIGPHDPADPNSYPPNSFVDNFAATTGGVTYAWRVAREKGALLATVRVNGRDNGDTANGSPVGTIYGISYFNDSFGQGWGYLMGSGAFDNGGGTSADLQMGNAGTSAGKTEASFDVAAALFPYEEGWLGAWVSGISASNGEATYSSASPNVPITAVVWQGDHTAGRAFVTLANINSATDGMLFVAAANSDNNTRIAAAAPRAGGWDVTIRDDENKDLTGATLATIDKSSFQFLYVPYIAFRLVGAQINGSNGAVIHGAGTDRFSISRTQAGEYALAVKKLDGTTPATGDDGMLILSVAGHMAGSTDLADRTFLSYRFDAGSGKFVIQSREVLANTGAFLDPAVLRDSDFYFAFIDFQNPVRAPEASCANGVDDDGNGLTDCADAACDASPNCQCNVPFADAEGNGAVGRRKGDGDVDQSDFALFQICYQGANGAIPVDPAYCKCFDSNQDGHIDAGDLDSFVKCVSGPALPWVSTPDCP